MLLYINKRLIEFKEDRIENIFIVNKDKNIGIEYTLYKESKGYIFRDAGYNPYRPHFPTAGMAINNALSNGEQVFQGSVPIPSMITQIDPKYIK